MPAQTGPTGTWVFEGERGRSWEVVLRAAGRNRLLGAVSVRLGRKRAASPCAPTGYYPVHAGRRNELVPAFI